MPNPQRLDILRQLRETAQLTQAEMAAICGLRGRRSHQTAGAWERGAMTPDARRRKRFIGYLWDDLGLRRNPAQFEAVWQVLVEEWGWQPIDAAEWATFTSLDRPAVGSTAALVDPSNEADLSVTHAPDGRVQGTPDVTLYTTAVAVRGRPAYLVGHGALLAELHEQLDVGESVLLYGESGVGKTALAATVAAARIQAGHGAVLWLQVGNASGAAIITVLVERLLPPPERMALRGEDGQLSPAAVADLLAHQSLGLVVADDAWDETLRRDLMQVLPDGVPLVVTSRGRWARMPCIEVGALDSHAAMTLLAHVAKRRKLDQLEGALDLCTMLECNPYALNLAGALLKLDGTLPPDQLALQIAYMPSDLPTGFAADRHTGIHMLLAHCVAMLEPVQQEVLAAFGILYAPGATTMLVAAILGHEIWEVETALRELSVRALARQTQPGYYELHELTFGYVRVWRKTRPQALRDVEGNAAIARYVAENRQDLALLELDQANVLGAAAAARLQDPAVFLSIMGDLAQGGYLDARGQTEQHMRLLDEAIALTAEPDFADDELRHILLSKRGNALVASGEYDRAVPVYEAALACAPSTARQIVLEAVLGKTHALAGQHDVAARRFRIATQLAESHDDIESLCTVLMQQSLAAAQAKDFATERDLALRGVQLSKQHGRTGEIGYFYLDLGTAEFDLGVHEALARHQDAYNYAVQADNEVLLAMVHRALGFDYLGMEDVESGLSHLAEALRLFDKVGYADEAERLRRFISPFGALAGRLNAEGD